MRDIAVEIPKPCSADWDAMEPEARSRFCAECRTRVHDLSSMTERQAERFLDANAEREDLCVSYLQNDRGDIVFAKPQIIAPRSLLRRLPAAAGLAAAMAACTPAAEVCEDEVPAAVEVQVAPPATAATDALDASHEPTRSLLAHPEDAVPEEVPQRADDPDAPDEPCDGGFSEQPPEPTTSTAPPTTKTTPPVHRTAGKPVVRRMGKRKRPSHLP